MRGGGTREGKHVHYAHTRTSDKINTTVLPYTVFLVDGRAAYYDTVESDSAGRWGWCHVDGQRNPMQRATRNLRVIIKSVL
jgi:hypothetical protein